MVRRMPLWKQTILGICFIIFVLAAVAFTTFSITVLVYGVPPHVLSLALTVVLISLFLSVVIVRSEWPIDKHLTPDPRGAQPCKDRRP